MKSSALHPIELAAGEVALKRCLELLKEHLHHLATFVGGSSNPEPLNLLQLMGQAYIQGIRDAVESSKIRIESDEEAGRSVAVTFHGLQACGDRDANKVADWLIDLAFDVRKSDFRVKVDEVFTAGYCQPLTAG